MAFHAPALRMSHVRAAKAFGEIPRSAADHSVVAIGAQVHAPRLKPTASNARGALLAAMTSPIAIGHQVKHGRGSS
jgi:hypothetical protein